MKDARKLRWIRACSPMLVPIDLIEQVKHREYTIEMFIQLAEQNMTNNNLELNPYFRIYVLTDNSNHIEGYCWFVIDPLIRQLYINTLSIRKPYVNGISAAIKFFIDFSRKAKLETVAFCARRINALKRYKLTPSEEMFFCQNVEKYITLK